MDAKKAPSAKQAATCTTIRGHVWSAGIALSFLNNSPFPLKTQRNGNISILTTEVVTELFIRHFVWTAVLTL